MSRLHSLKSLFPALILIAFAGCGGESDKPVSLENFDQTQKKQEEVIRKEYGSEAAKAIK